MYTYKLLESEMMSKKRQLKTVQERIQGAAIELFAQFGVTNTSVKQILDEAKVSRRTFYNYFDSKTDLLTKIPNIKAISNLYAFFLAKFPQYFELEPYSQLDFLFEGLYAMLKTPSALDFLYLQILQSEELLSILEIDVKDCYRKNFEFVFELFKKCNIEDPIRKAQFFLFFLDGILLNCSLFTKYQVPFSFQEWLDNTWEEMKLALNITEIYGAMKS